MKLLKIIWGKEPIAESKTEFIVKVPLILLLIVLFAISPFLIAISGAWLTKLVTGQECLNEGSCFWAVIPWLCFYTLPAGIVLGIRFLLKSFREIKNKN